MEFLLHGKRIVLQRGDITSVQVDGIVNAANSSLMGGGGVDGAIHRAGGPEILEECKALRQRQGPCRAGDAVVTGAGKLPCRYLIHTVGPVWSGGERGEDEILAAAYRASLARAEEMKLSSVAFPAISTGAYRFPVDRAARIAVRTVSSALEHSSVKEVRFVVFSAEHQQVYESALQALLFSEDTP